MKWLFLVFHMKLTCLAPHSHVVSLPNQSLVTQSISLPPWWCRCWDSKELLFSCSVVSDSLQPPWTAARQASLSFTISQSFLKLMPIESVMPSNHLILCCPLFSSHLQSFPASGSFQMSQLFTSGSQSTGVSASASVFPVNTQVWSPLGWIGWVSLQSKGLARVFSNTTVQKHQFFGT